MFDKINLFKNDKISKIRLKNISWDELFDDKTILYKAICDLLLNEENLLYYITQKESSKTLVETRKYVRKLIENGSILNSINDIFNSIGWNKDIDILNTTFQGDLAEYLMNVLLDKITNIDTLISKISFKTSTNMPIYGNDNIYYDYENDTLYFGESKFYNDIKQALNKAMKSIEKHAIIEEISFIRNHTTAFIAENGKKRLRMVEKFEQNFADNINIKSVIFIVNDDIYEKDKYETAVLNHFRTIEKIEEVSSEIIFIFLPILSKTDFLNYFVGRLNNE